MITQTLSLPRAFQTPVRVGPPQATTLGALDTFAPQLSKSGKVQFYASATGAVAGGIALGLGTARLAGTAATVVGAVQGAVAVGCAAAIVGGIVATKIWGNQDLGDIGLAIGGAVVGGGAGAIGGAFAGAALGVSTGNIFGYAAGALGGAVVGYIFGKGLTSH